MVAGNIVTFAADYGLSVAMDGTGNLVVAGYFLGSQIDCGGGWLYNAGGSDAFVAKYSPTGGHIWSRNFGGSSTDQANSVAVDPSGNVFLLGLFTGTVNFGGGFSLTDAGGYDAFLAKCSSVDGSTQWAKALKSGGTYDWPNNVAADASGNAVVVGNFRFPIDMGGAVLSPVINAVQNFYVAKYSPTGGYVWGDRFGGTAIEDGIGVTFDANSNVHVTGFFQGTATFGTQAITSLGSTDMYLLRIAGPLSSPPPPPPTNQAPTVNAGLDQIITLPSLANLSGTASDDGLPNPPATLTTTWSVVSGPGTVTFGNVSSKLTTATFLTAGSYTLRLTASDSSLSASDDIVITVNPPADTTPPVISAVGSAGITTSVATINWTTNENSDSQVMYGVTTAYGSATPIDSTMLTSHSQGLSGLSPSTLYNYCVKSKDAAGNMATSANFTFTTPAAADTTAPTTPSNLTASAVSSSQINLSWGASSDNVGVAGYRIYRAGSLIATVGNVTSYSNTGLFASTSYSYQVTAIDAAGNASLMSNSASATTSAAADTTVPSTPGNLTATAISASQINLGWVASTDNVGVTGYRIYRGGVLLATVGGTVVSYSNTGLSASTAYSYQVTAIDAAGNASLMSNSASATTQAAPDTTLPSTPGNLTATAISASQINLGWVASTDNVGVTGYRIYRGGVLLATVGGTVVSYSNTGLAASTAYSYQVSAIDAANNESVKSNTASATTPAAPDTTAPVITVLPHLSNLYNKGATILWTTNEISDSKVEYGPTAGFGYQMTNGSLVTNHSITLSNLSPNKGYYFRVTSKDAAGNAVISSNYSFVTSGSGQLTALSLNSSPTSSEQSGFGSYQNILSPQSGSNITINYWVSGTDSVSTLANGDASGGTEGISGEVIITVFNRSGDVVRKLSGTEATPGSHSVTWDGRNDHGSLVASGTYLVVMQRGDLVSKSKVVVVR